MKHLTGHRNALDSRTDFLILSFFIYSFVRPSIYLFFCLFLGRMNITHHFWAMKCAWLSANLCVYERKSLRKSLSWSWSSYKTKITIHVHKYLYVYKYIQLYTEIFMKMLYTCAFDLSLRKFFLLLFWTNVRTPTRS